MIAIVLVVVYGMIIWFDSSSLTPLRPAAAGLARQGPRSRFIKCSAVAASSGR
jgi:hypothetical protein